MRGAHAPEVSVVVATRNRAGQLDELLAGLRSQTLDSERFEVIVVDDGSTDGTGALLERSAGVEGFPLRTIERSSSAGPATARDDGWRAARGEIVAFTDDDCVPEPGWLEAGLEACGERSAALVQGRTEPPPGEFEGLGPLQKPFARTIRVTDLDPAFQTCNVFYPRSLLERIDGFDTEAFGRDPGGEDSDLAWRAIAAGAQPVYCEAAAVHHAVNRLGPLGKLRVAARWTTPLRVYARHPELKRAHFTRGVFWKNSHYLLARALAALVLPRRLRFLAPWLVAPYARDLVQRGRVEGGGWPLAPYYLLHDLIEMGTVLRAAIRYRTPMI
jgi:glycosyltransferase involved in cell wall biosynthesis